MTTFFEFRKKGDSIFFSNLPDVLESDKLLKKSFQDGDWIVDLTTNELDLLNSNRLFKKIGALSLELFISIYKSNKERLDQDYHTLEKIQTKLSQELEQIIQKTAAQLKGNYASQKIDIIDYIVKNPEQIADELLYLRKRVFELGAHMLSSKINNNPESLPLNHLLHNISKLMLNIWLPFEEEAKNINVKCDWKVDNDFAEQHKIYLDYTTFNVALFNFFDNLVKYIKPNSSFSIFFDINGDENVFKIIFEMMSLRIERDEKERIFHYGTRGSNCVKEHFPYGNGIGMFTLKRALSLNKISLNIESDYSDSEVFNNVKYVKNIFTFKGQYKSE